MDNEKLTAGQVEEAGKTVVKKKRPNSSINRSVQTAPGDNTKYIDHSLRLAELPKVSMSDPAAVADRVTEYFRICSDDDMKPSFVGLAVAFGMDRITLYRYREGIIGKHEDVRIIIKRASALLDLQMSDYMQNGKINPVSGIFLMKNNFGYQDKTEVVVSPVVPLGDQSDENALVDRYNDAVVVDDFEDVTDGRPENG